MRGTTVLATALLLSAAPLGAQQFVWTADRPDGVAPVGIAADRTLPGGTLEVGYRFGRMDAEGLKFGTDPFTEDEALELFEFVPLTRKIEAHTVTLGYGITDALTLMVAGGWIDKTREQANEEVFFSTSSSGIADAEAALLWQVYARGPYRGHLQLGVVAPLGSIDERGDIPEAADVILPYDMQLGLGSWAITPGLGAQAMNDVGSVGGQLRGIIPLADNDRGYRPGVRLEARAWAAHAFNDFVSVSGGVRATAVEPIEGFDPELETFRDPGDLSLSFGGNRVDLPVGVNLLMPAGPLAGHRFGLEFVWTVHEDVDGPNLASDWGFTAGWQTELDFGGLLSSGF